MIEYEIVDETELGVHLKISLHNFAYYTAQAVFFEIAREFSDYCIVSTWVEEDDRSTRLLLVDESDNEDAPTLGKMLEQ